MKSELFNQLKMFHGSLQEIANRANWEHQSVRKFLRDDGWQNDEVLSIAQAVLKERKDKMKALLTTA
jgi:uncharacterized protein YjcR